MRPIDDAHSTATQLRPDIVAVRKLLTDHLPSIKKHCQKSVRELSLREEEERAPLLRALCTTELSAHGSCNDRSDPYELYRGYARKGTTLLASQVMMFARHLRRGRAIRLLSMFLKNIKP